jgi:hypothetical protein
VGFVSSVTFEWRFPGTALYTANAVFVTLEAP